MPEVLPAPDKQASAAAHPDVTAFLNTLSPDLRQDSGIQQIINSGGDVASILQQLQNHQGVQAYMNNAIAQTAAASATPAQTTGSAYDALGAILMDKLTTVETRKNASGADEAVRVMKFATTDANSGEQITAAVPVTKITVHDQMQNGTEQLIFKVHVDDQNTIYQQDMAKAIAAKITELHPDFKPTAENPQPVRASSEHFDSSVTFVADVPPGKTANIVSAEIQHPEKYTGTAPQAAAFGAPQVTEVNTTAAPIVKVDCGDTTVVTNVEGTKQVTKVEATAPTINATETVTETNALPIAGGFAGGKIQPVVPPQPKDITSEGISGQPRTGAAVGASA